jgi:L-glyceraldehyde 3-phosphate reductase
MGYLAAADRYQHVGYRRCGRSGVMLPEVSLGLWQNFGDERRLDTQRAIIRRPFDLGVTHSTWRTTTGRRSVRYAK